MILRTEYEVLRDPDRQPKCYELTDHEREVAIIKLSQLKNILELNDERR